MDILFHFFFYSLELPLLIFITILPLTIGLVALLAAKLSPSPKALLLHHVFSEKRWANSLSEISSAQLENFCKETQERGLKLSSLVDRTPQSIPLTFDDGFSSLTIACDILEKYNYSATLFVTTAHFTNKKTYDVYPSIEKIDAEKLKDLSRRGFEIGSHSVTHRALTLLPDSEVIAELKESKRVLEDIIGGEVDSFSFPLGMWDERTLSLAREAGYRRFAVYAKHSKIGDREDIFPVTAIYPFDTSLHREGKTGGGDLQGRARAVIVPHFAQGSPLAKPDRMYQFYRAFRTHLFS